MLIYPVIMSGGAGSRLWPLSREANPKQFLEIFNGKSLFHSTCMRVNGDLYGPVTVLCNQDHRFLVAEELKQSSLENASIILEPVGRNTAPAAAIASEYHARQDPDRLILLLPADHIINDVAAFTKAMEVGVASARAGKIVTFGVRPDEPHTGYGYIHTGDVHEDGSSDVKQFVEKPDKATAQHYIEDGNYLWNAGIFLFRAGTMLDNFSTDAPEIIEHCRLALDSAQQDLDFLRLDKVAYDDCQNISVDFAIMENAANIACVPLDADWNDLGSWTALSDIMEKDADGNASHGEAMFEQSTNCLAYSADGATIALVGLDEVLAVATKDAVLVASKSSAQDVKSIVDTLKRNGREQAVFHPRVYRPWGWYEGVSSGERYQVKCLMVKPGAKLSLQHHHHRAEHWVVVSGTAKVTVGDEVKLLTENESTYIPVGALHRLENPGKIPALLIEVQSGAYLGEDDIVREEDQYGRIATEVEETEK